MKEFAVAYEMNGKKQFARIEANTSNEAKATFEAGAPGAEVTNVIELDDNLKKILDFVKPTQDKELDAIQADIEQNKLQRANDEKKEDQRRSKFKYYKQWKAMQPKQLDPDKKEYLLDLADNVLNTNSDFRKETWKKLLDKFMTPSEIKDMQKEFEADAKEHWKSNKKNLDRELEVIKRIFGDNKGKWSGGGDASGTLTFQEIATAWGCSHSLVKGIYF